MKSIQNQGSGSRSEIGKKRPLKERDSRDRGELQFLVTADGWRFEPQVGERGTGKDSDAGRDWGQEEKGTTEDEMAGWHH